MADGANRAVRIGKLLRMAAGTRQMIRGPRTFRNRTRFASMTQQARQSGMILGAMLESSVVESFRKLHLLLRRLRLGAIIDRTVSTRIDNSEEENADND
jgi:hypothetical protein